MKFLSRLLSVFLALCLAAYLLPALGIFGSVASYALGPKSPLPELIRVVPELSRAACWHIYGILIALILMIWLNAPSTSSPGERKVFYIWDENRGITGPKAFGEMRDLLPETLVWSSREGSLGSWFPLRSWHGNGTPRNSRRTQIFMTTSTLTLMALHTYHNFGLAPATIFLGAFTVAFGCMVFVVKGSGEVAQLPAKSFLGVFSNSPRPPLFAVHGKGSHKAKTS